MSIKKQLAVLCIQRKEFRSLGIDLIIKTYDWPLSYSYIIVDPESKNPLIKIEEITNKNPELRESSLAYRSDNFVFYEEHWKEFQAMQNIRKYICRG